MHSNIVASISPDPVMDKLFSKQIGLIRFDDYYRLRHIPVSTDRCREMMSLLYFSPYPQAFIHLRLALLDEYSLIVDEIDKQLTSQMQLLHMDRSTDGKRPLQAFICSLFTQSCAVNDYEQIIKLLSVSLSICVFDFCTI